MKIKFFEPRNPAILDGIELPYAAAKRRSPIWRWRVMLLAAATPVLYFAGLHIRDAAFVSAPGFVSFKTVELHAPGNGIVRRVFIGPGAVVRTGQQLFQLGNALFDAESAAISSQIAATKPVRGRTDAVIIATQQEEAAAAEALDAAQAEYLRLAHLFSRKAATNSELAASLDNVLAKKSQLRRISVAVQREAAAHETVDARVRVAQLLAQRQSVLAEVHQLQVAAPIDGVVVSVDVSPGEEATADRRLALIRSSQQPLVRAYLAPIDQDYAAIGREATVVFATGQQISARVAKVSYKAQPVQRATLPGFVSESQGIEIMLGLTRAPQWLTQVDGLPVTVRFNRLGGLLDQIHRIALSSRIH
jgi:multidrug resistance efflux pump